jgi:uncharacterized membrane protein YcaP (DUF421 family)
MDYNWIWETIVIFFVGKIILRIGGRKSISQMTITQTIVMVGIGSLLIQPIAENEIYATLLVALLFTVLMVVTEYLEVKYDILETFFSGKAVIVIKDGKPDLNKLKRLRLTIDRLETRLRQNGVSSMEDVKMATIEVSGQLGYEIKDDKKPITKEDFMVIMSEIADLKKLMNGYDKTKASAKENMNLFNEVKDKTQEGAKEP